MGKPSVRLTLYLDLVTVWLSSDKMYSKWNVCSEFPCNFHLKLPSLIIQQDIIINVRRPSRTVTDIFVRIFIKLFSINF